jgi:prevent-host-death family protein
LHSLVVSTVSIRDLRNHGGEVVERAQRGERLTVTRAGKPVAQLTPLGRAPLSLEELRERRARLPIVDPAELRGDAAQVIDDSI